MTINSRTKGKGGELEVVKIFKPYFTRAKRGLQMNEPELCDVEGIPHLRTEVKRRKKVPAIEPALEQCKRDGDKFGDPRTVCAITRRDHGKWIISFYLEEFLEEYHG